MLKNLEVLLNIASYGFLAMICVTIVRIGMKLCGIKIFDDRR